MRTKYQYTFKFLKTMEEAQKESLRIYNGYNKYLQKRYGAPRYHWWSSEGGKEKAVLLWYYI